MTKIRDLGINTIPNDLYAMANECPQDSNCALATQCVCTAETAPPPCDCTELQSDCGPYTDNPKSPKHKNPKHTLTGEAIAQLQHQMRQRMAPGDPNV